ncbi:MAG: DUF6115 domain-containing protein [bacterium]
MQEKIWVLGLIGIGTIFITFSIWDKYKEKKDIASKYDGYYIEKIDKGIASQTNIIEKKENIENVCLDDTKKLNTLKLNLTKLIEDVSYKEQEVQQVFDRLNKIILDQVKRTESNLELIAEKQNFKQLLNKNLSINSGFEEKNPSNKESFNLPEKYREVFTLLEKGSSIEEIAEKLNYGVREIEIVMRLYNIQK